MQSQADHPGSSLRGTPVKGEPVFVRGVRNADLSALLREIRDVFYSVGKGEAFYTCWQDKTCVPTREISE